jgi:pimeloyl-ACP methyl ester carboxylesterase
MTVLSIRLPDGRKLSYAEYGTSNGVPLFFFHGLPGSRLLRHPNNSIATSLGVRIITTDRPGMGYSDFQSGRSLLDWPDDVAALADALEIEQFTVAGFSGGGPFVVACARKIPHRLKAAGLLSGIGPIEALGALKGMISTNRMGYTVGRFMPWFLWRLQFRFFFGSAQKHPEKLARVTDAEPQADKPIFAQRGVRKIFTETFREAFQQGTDGAAWEGWLLCRPWGFRLEDISTPVYLWQGEDDNLVTPAMGRHMAEKIPNCQAIFIPGEGHLLFIKYWDEILRTLILNPLAG